MSRIESRAPVDTYVNKMIDGVPHLARTRDISASGIFLHQLLEPSTPAGAHLAVEILLPGTEMVIWAEAEVMHGTDGQGAGLRFLDLAPEHAALIDTWVQRANC